MISTIKKDLVYILILILLPTIFFAKLFVNPQTVFYPADFLLSDLIHVNLAQKTALAHSYRANQLPFIDDRLAHGFPLLAESQIGALSPINYLLYRTLPINMAFNLTYYLGFVIMNLSFFALVRKLTHNSALAIFGAISWMFTGIVMQEIVHQVLIQAIFLIPLIFFLAILVIEKKSMSFPSLLAFVAGQQFLFGQFFISLATNLFLLGLFVTFAYYNQHRLAWWHTIKKYLFYLSLFTLIILPQLLQTLIFTQYSNRATPNGGDLLANTFEIPYFLTLLTPFPFGSFKNGEFFRSHLWQTTQTIPWESSLFLGYALLPALILIFIINKRPKDKIKCQLPSYWLTFTVFSLFLSALLMFGYRSPLKLLFTLPILSSFRIMTRFSIFTSFFLLLLITQLLGRLKLSSRLLFGLVLLQLSGGFYHFYNYFPTVDYRDLTKPPKTAKYLGNQGYYEFGSAIGWFNTFAAEGYGNPTEYLKFHEGQYPYLNLIYGSSSCGLFKYSNYNPLAIDTLVTELDRQLGEDKESAWLSKRAANLLRVLGCQKLVTPLPYRNLPLSKRVNQYKVYTLNMPLPPYQLYSKTEPYFSSAQFLNRLKEKINFSALYRRDFAEEFLPPKHSIVRPLLLTNTHKRFQVRSDQPQYFFLRQLWYPGWSAKVDKTPVPIAKAFELYQLIKVPRGKHLVEFTYYPPYWTISILLSATGYLFTLGILVVELARSKNDKHAHP